MANNPGFKSCLLRVPYTFNSECVNEGIDAEVKIVQQWEGSKPLPEIDNLRIEFQTFLVDKKLKTELNERVLVVFLQTIFCRTRKDFCICQFQIIESLQYR